ncbi:MAG: hypothetical protein ACYTF6_05755, partial [Planctomycetota bacterium]
LVIYRADFADWFPWLQQCDNEPKAAKAGGADDLYKLIDANHDNILENLNLLVYRSIVTYEVFLCPSVGATAAAQVNANKKWGFFCYPDGDADQTPQWYIDYGYHVGVPTLPGGSSNPASFNKVPGDFAILADADVGNKERADEGWNHGTAGVNLSAADMSVFFFKPDDDDYVVRLNDNIYNSGGTEDAPVRDDSGTPDAYPAHTRDQVLYSPK